MNTEAFTMWENSIIFQNGMFFYRDGKGHNSFICRERAKEIEVNYYKYQASMDVDRGGWDPDTAYPGRGFSKNENGEWQYTRACRIDIMKNGAVVRAVEGDFVIPRTIGTNKINSVNRIEKRAFYNCANLSQVTIPETITSIGSEAFVGCTNLNKIIMSDSIKAIEEKAFADTAYYNNKENWVDNALYLNGWLIKVNTAAEGAFHVQDGTIGIADTAFRDCDKLTHISIPDSVQYIGSHAFEGCSQLVEISFPEKVLKFGTGVLKKCASLEHVKLPIGIGDLSGMFLDNENLISVEIPEGVTKIGSAAFQNCIHLTDIKLPDSITSISSSAFKNTGYVNDKSNWADGVLYLGKWILLADSALAGNYVVKAGTLGIADSAFGKPFCQGACVNLTGVEMPDTVKYIGEGAFEGCKNLEHIDIPNSLRHISRSLFRDCSCLKEVIIPYSVKTMDIWVFYHCASLESVTIENPNLDITWPAIVSCPKLTVYAAHNSTAEAYTKKYEIAFQDK